MNPASQAMHDFISSFREDKYDHEQQFSRAGIKVTLDKVALQRLQLIGSLNQYLHNKNNSIEDKVAYLDTTLDAAGMLFGRGGDVSEESYRWNLGYNAWRNLNEIWGIFLTMKRRTQSKVVHISLLEVTVTNEGKEESKWVDRTVSPMTALEHLSSQRRTPQGDIEEKTVRIREISTVPAEDKGKFTHIVGKLRLNPLWSEQQLDDFLEMFGWGVMIQRGKKVLNYSGKDKDVFPNTPIVLRGLATQETETTIKTEDSSVDLTGIAKRAKEKRQGG